MAKHIVCFAICILLILQFADCKRTNSGNRKTSSSGSSTRRQPAPSTHVTKPTYTSNTGGAGDSHSDLAKLSYSGYNSQPNRPQTAGSATGTGTQNAPPIGWNVPKQQQPIQGPPPAYSATNPIGGARTNMHEAPPAYNAHSPITATHAQGVQSGYPGQHGGVGGGYPIQSGYPMQGTPYHQSGYPGQHGGVGGYQVQSGYPMGATYIPSGAALPPGAVLYSQPPSSSGPGFGTGLAAGALGGALVGHLLTPSQSRGGGENAPTNSGGGEDKIIIINNGQPVPATQLANGTTIIAPAGVAEQSSTEAAAPLAPMVPMSGVATTENATSGANDNNSAVQAPPAPGGIICVPVRMNETDPTDNTKQIEIEKIACYPAPPPPPQEQQNGENGAPPLAPMNPASEPPSQQLQQTPAQSEASQQNKTNDAGNTVVPTALIFYITWIMGFYLF